MPMRMNNVKLSPSFILLCAVLASCISFCSATATLAQSWMEKIGAASRAKKAHDFVSAEKFYLAALKEAEESGPDDPKIALTLRDIADLYMMKGDLDKAEQMFLRQLKIADGIGSNRSPSFDRENKSHALCALAQIASEHGRPSRVEELLRKALPLQEEEFGPYSSKVAETLRAISGCCSEQKKFSESIAALERAMLIDQKLHPNGLVVSYDLETLSILYGVIKEFELSERCARQSMIIRSKLCKPSDPNFIQAKLRLAFSLSDNHKFDQAAPIFKEVQELAPLAYGHDSVKSSITIVSFANSYANQKMYKESIPLYKKALAIQQKLLLPGDSTLIKCTCWFANAYLHLGDKVSARRVCQSALDRVVASDKTNKAAFDTLRKKLAECQ